MGSRCPGRGFLKGLWLLCIGCILIAVGLSLGGRWTTPAWWPWHSGDLRFEWGADSDTAGKNEIHDIAEDEDVLPATVSSIEVELKAAGLAINTGPVASYRITGFDGDRLAISVDGTRVRFEEKHWPRSIDFDGDFPKQLVEITIPEGVALDDCRISVGAGAVSITGLTAKSLSIESGAGSITARDLNAERVRLETGAGSLDLAGCRFDDTRIETGAGRIAFKGSLGTHTEISTGAGAVSLLLTGSAKDYRFDFTRGVGSVRIGDETHSGIGEGGAGNRDAKRVIKLLSGVGSISVDFTD